MRVLLVLSFVLLSVNVLANYKQSTKSVTGTYYNGELDASYAELTKLFGIPDSAMIDDNKTTIQWDLENAKGDVVTVYNWTEDNNQYNWHIGSFDLKTANDFVNWLQSKGIKARVYVPKSKSHNIKVKGLK